MKNGTAYLYNKYVLRSNNIRLYELHKVNPCIERRGYIFSYIFLIKHLCNTCILWKLKRIIYLYLSKALIVHDQQCNKTLSIAFIILYIHIVNDVFFLVLKNNFQFKLYTYYVLNRNTVFTPRNQCTESWYTVDYARNRLRSPQKAIIILRSMRRACILFDNQRQFLKIVITLFFRNMYFNVIFSKFSKLHQ